MNPLLNDAEPCENCGLPVVVFTVKGVRSMDERPHLYEVTDRGDTYPWSTKMVTHTPERCREARSLVERTGQGNET